MAGLLGVARNTVLAAYDDLAADGLIVGQRGSGTRVDAKPGVMPLVRRLLREAQYPAGTAAFHDPDGNPVRFHF